MNPWFALYVAIATAVVGWVGLLYQAHQHGVAKTRADKAEREMRENKRRALDVCPYFAVSTMPFSAMMIAGSKPGEMVMVTDHQPYVLSFGRDEVGNEIQAGYAVILIIENHGREGNELTLSLDGGELSLEHSIDPGSEVQFAFVYPFNPAKRGQVQRIELRFLRTDGVRDVHVYETKHGMRYLRRVEPA